MQIEPIEFDFETTRLVFHPESFGNHAVSQALKITLPLRFKMTCKNSKNSCALNSNFDEMLQQRLVSAGFALFKPDLPPGLEKRSDFGFEIGGIKIVFEIEKANWEKIFYDIFKAHIYLKSGADFFVLMLPLAYGHANGTEPLFEIAKTRFEQSQKVGYGDPLLLKKILLVGFDQLYDGQEFSHVLRNKLRDISSNYFQSKAT